ncbi:cytochrome P450 family protein [Mycolicibacterium confluentis]|uniref:Steroid C26-monooxygenase n=1 Tax=Mycolicibacterium confluentis TaxID=28047 RepID=A0A7I7Y5X5_9MYCO|nr:cytochrome P450 [Mycolicibacterium confluentis]MCV7319295.1 cytochrome P450 [Mycolicibacterium confluentis]ORV25765.1 cytochrome [Mycolicibacterium confluentis]BBZ36493.1 cytochrome P450 [Mycolicibacterium confluentis]
MNVQQISDRRGQTPFTLDDSFFQDPHAVYAELRRRGAVHRVRMWSGADVWMVTGYAEARKLLADPRLKKHGPTASSLFPPSHPTTIGTVLGDNMLFRDPPDHTRLRRLVTAAFTARTVRGLRPAVVGIADDLLAAMSRRAPGRVDLVQSFAQPLPLRVISELLGVPPESRERFSSLVMPIFNTSVPAEVDAAQQELTQLLQSIVAAKRKEPAKDVLGHLVHLRDDGDRLTEDELLGTAFLLIVAGFETTVNLIASGVLALLRNPAQMTAVRADRTLLPSAIEEMLRCESPLSTATARFTGEPVRVGDIEIPAGELVIIALLGANRDELQFHDPDAFNVSRTDNRHLAFGHGIHHCIGAPLARMEAEIALDGLLTRFSHIELAADEPLTYRPSALMRGLVSLPVELGGPR